MVVASADAAVANAKAATSCDPGYCLKYTRSWLAIASYYSDATTAWAKAKHRHPGDTHPPKGAPVFYTGGKHGHIALSLGGGKIRTTDAPNAGKVTTQDLTWPARAWGYPYAGWSEDLNTVTIPWLQEDDMEPKDVWNHKIDNPVSDDPDELVTTGNELRFIRKDVYDINGRVKGLEQSVAKILAAVTGGGS